MAIAEKSEAVNPILGMLFIINSTVLPLRIASHLNKL
jgi:hypothetical protein